MSALLKAPGRLPGHDKAERARSDAQNRSMRNAGIIARSVGICFFRDLVPRREHGAEARARRRPASSEAVAYVQACRARLDRMEVHVLHAFGRLTGQPGRVVVRDVLAVGIEEVQHVEPQIETAALEADRGIHDGRRTRPRAAVLDQGAWTEITYPGAAVPSARSLKRDARRHYAIDRAWDLVSGRIVLRELGLG